MQKAFLKIILHYWREFRSLGYYGLNVVVYFGLQSDFDVMEQMRQTAWTLFPSRNAREADLRSRFAGSWAGSG